MDVAKISSTSAFVLLLAMNGIHAGDAAKKFLGMLDLGAGRSLLERCNRFWPHYREVIMNRKSCILGLARRAVLRDGFGQVVILGAGFDTLSLEISSASRGCRIFEVDIARMGDKQDLIRRADPSLSGRIECIEADVSSPREVLAGLAGRGWDREGPPSLLVLEGISYYLPPDAMWEVISLFGGRRGGGGGGGGGGSRVILEYLLPEGQIAGPRRPVARYPFDLIAEEARLDGIARYARGGVAGRVAGLGGSVLDCYDLGRMERDRLGRNRLFGGDRSGWIEVCEFAA